MVTSSITLLINGLYEQISPATNIESLYIEQVKMISDTSAEVNRRSLYKHFPIGVNTTSLYAVTISEFSALPVQLSYVLSVGNFFVSRDLAPIQSGNFKKNKDIKSSTNRNLLSLTCQTHNIGMCLAQYTTKWEYSIWRDNINSKLNNPISGIKKQVLNLNTSVNDLNVIPPYGIILNPDTVDGVFTPDSLSYYILTYHSKPGYFYKCLYTPNPDPTNNTNSLILLLRAINETVDALTAFASKTVGFSLNNLQNILPWDIDCKFTLNSGTSEIIITYMKDEYGNEAPYDFKYYKTFKDEYDNDLSLTGRCYNNKILSNVSDIELKTNSGIICNNYIGYNCKIDIQADNICNNTIYNENILENIKLSGGDFSKNTLFFKNVFKLKENNIPKNIINNIILNLNTIKVFGDNINISHNNIKNKNMIACCNLVHTNISNNCSIGDSNDDMSSYGADLYNMQIYDKVTGFMRYRDNNLIQTTIMSNNTFDSIIWPQDASNLTLTIGISTFNDILQLYEFPTNMNVSNVVQLNSLMVVKAPEFRTTS